MNFRVFFFFFEKYCIALLLLCLMARLSQVFLSSKTKSATKLRDLRERRDCLYQLTQDNGKATKVYSPKTYLDIWNFFAQQLCRWTHLKDKGSYRLCILCRLYISAQHTVCVSCICVEVCQILSLDYEQLLAYYSTHNEV